MICLVVQRVHRGGTHLETGRAEIARLRTDAERVRCAACAQVEALILGTFRPGAVSSQKLRHTSWIPMRRRNSSWNWLHSGQDAVRESCDDRVAQELVDGAKLPEPFHRCRLFRNFQPPRIQFRERGPHIARIYRA